MKPAVYKDVGGYWVAELDHQTWIDRTDFDTWEKAWEHAEWLWWCAWRRS